MGLEHRLKALETAGATSSVPVARELTDSERKAFRLAEAVCVTYHLGDPVLPALLRFYSGIAAGNAASDLSQPYRNTLKGRFAWSVYKMQYPTPGQYRGLAKCVSEIPESDYEALCQSLEAQIGEHHPELFNFDADNRWCIEAKPDGRIIANHKDPETAYELSGALALAFGPKVTADKAGGSEKLP